MLDKTAFFEMLKKYPRFEGLWNGSEVDIKLLESTLATCSHGEAIMLRFLAGVWLGINRYDFDLIEAAGVLDVEDRQVISQYLMSPIWP